jgi:hypothetical protein
MPDCDICGNNVKRRKTLKDQMKMTQIIDEFFNDLNLIRKEIMVCESCYNFACRKNPSSETCEKLRNYLKESNEIEDDIIKMKLDDKCKKCNVLSNRRKNLQASNKYDDVLDEIYTCGRCYDDKCFKKSIEPSTACKNVDKNKKLATYQRERMDDKNKEKKLIANITLAEAYPEKYIINEEFFPKVPKYKF